MTPSPDYDVLEELAKAAMEGEVVATAWFTGPQIRLMADLLPEDAAFIAAASPVAILALIAKARAGEAAVEALEALVSAPLTNTNALVEAKEKARTALSRIREGEQ